MMGHEIVLAWTENSRTGEKTLSKLRYQASNSDLGLSLEEWQRNFLIDKLKGGESPFRCTFSSG